MITQKTKIIFFTGKRIEYLLTIQLFYFKTIDGVKHITIQTRMKCL